MEKIAETRAAREGGRGGPWRWAQEEEAKIEETARVRGLGWGRR